MRVFSVNSIAELLERDRATVVRALRDVPADATERHQPRWRMATAVTALEKHNRASSEAVSVHPELDATFAKFDVAYDAMKVLPTLHARRKAAIALKPLIEAIDGRLRVHGRAIGVGDELADRRADDLWRLTMRGFESPCEWNFDETLEHLGC